jgi:predicted component of type VI protein secretion system
MAPVRALLGPHSATPAELKARLEADRAGAPYLVFREADGTQRIVRLGSRGTRYTVGRAPSADVSLSWDERVSRVHAEFEHLSGDWAVVDNGLSRNGTFVNGDRVSGRRRLRSGDVLRFGATQVAFRAPIRTLGETLDAVSTPLPAVSEAQRRVLVALCRPCAGRTGPAAPATNREIADELVLSIEGVKTHLRALFQSFGVEDLPQNAKRARLVELAFTSGAVSPRDLTP